MDDFDNFYGRNESDGVSSSEKSEANSTQTINPQHSDSFYSYSYVNQGESRKHTPYDEPKKREKKSFGQAVLKCIAFALIFGLVSGGIFSGVVRITGANTKVKTVYYGNKESRGVESTATNTTTKLVTDVSGIVSNVMPSIVAITNTSEKEINGFFGQNQSQQERSSGSGIIIGQDEEQLLIVTNNHVVKDADSITVSFIDNKTAKATVKGTSPSSDLAIVSVDISSLGSSTLSAIKVAVMGNSTTLKVGEPTIAIGNALGYGQSVTTGVVSAVNRKVTVEDVTCSVIQTDAAINPGNSGGALLNTKGEVIGINSSKYADAEVEGIGFAIPISDAQPIIDKLITKKAVDAKDQAYLGIYGVDVSDDVSAVYKMPVGIYVTQLVSNLAAEEAGIRAGDVITKFNGEVIKTMEDLQEQLQYCKAGDKVTITVQRSEKGQYKAIDMKVKLSKATDKKN